MDVQIFLLFHEKLFQFIKNKITYFDYKLWQLVKIV